MSDDIETICDQLLELANDNIEFYYGGCPVFAVALHDLSRWPMYALVDRDAYALREVLHAYVRPDRRTVVDVWGPRTLTAIYADFDQLRLHPESVKEVHLNRATLLRLSGANPYCPTIAAALPIAREVLALTRQLHQLRHSHCRFEDECTKQRGTR